MQFLGRARGDAPGGLRAGGGHWTPPAAKITIAGFVGPRFTDHASQVAGKPLFTRTRRKGRRAAAPTDFLQKPYAEKYLGYCRERFWQNPYGKRYLFGRAPQPMQDLYNVSGYSLASTMSPSQMRGSRRLNIRGLLQTCEHSKIRPELGVRILASRRRIPLQQRGHFGTTRRLERGLRRFGN